MKSPHTIWASIVVIFILVSSATTLVILDKNVSIILTLAALVAVPVLGAYGVAVYHKLDQVKESGDGHVNRVVEMQQQIQDQLTALALAMTPAPGTPPEEGVKEKSQ